MKITSFAADENLLYAIQQTTKMSSVDILAYFFTMSQHLIEATSKSKARRLNKRLKTIFPNTGIIYDIEVWGGWYPEKRHLFSVSVRFPKNTTYFEDLAQTVEKISEAALLGGDMPVIKDFEKPQFKVPPQLRKMFKND